MCVIPLFTAFPQISIALQPLGKIDTTLLMKILPLVSREYNNADFKIMPEIKIPQTAYYKPRNRFRAEILLDYLDSIKGDAFEKIIGITRLDISTTKGEYGDWGIFGLGNIGGYSCVVSVRRLTKNASKELFKTRLRKIITHELGHTFGLYHCDWTRCVMTDYKGTIASLDDCGYHLCTQCREKFRKKNEL
jgi:archaemetzincin